MINQINQSLIKQEANQSDSLIALSSVLYKPNKITKQLHAQNAQQSVSPQ